MTTKLLANQLRSILNEPVEGFAVELPDEANLYIWRVWIEGPKDTCYYGGIFQLSLTFPKDYPMAPPELKFVSDFWHPNVFSTGKVCMSILHPPGEDAMSGELPEERWLPTQSVTTIILSLMSLLNDPNCASPANVDASVEWRNHRDAFKSRCARLVEKAVRELPPHVVIPHPESDVEQRKRRVQKFNEMNKDLGYEDFYEDDAGGGVEEKESGDENEFSESENEEINTDDEQSPKEMPRDPAAQVTPPPITLNHDEEVSNEADKEKEKEKEKEKGKEKEEENVSIDVVVVPTNNPDNNLPSVSSSSSSSGAAASEEVSGANTIASPSSSQLPSVDSNNNSNNVNNTNNNEISAENNNNNNGEASTGPKSKKGKKVKNPNKKGKKCVIM